jgi:hypothetical protein
VTLPDQSQLSVPMTWQSAADCWEGTVRLPPNTNATSVVCLVKWIARDAYGQTSQTPGSPITIEPAGTGLFQILGISSEDGGWRIRWSASPGNSYQLQATSGFSPAAWEDIGPITVATTEQASQFVENGGGKAVFFRVVAR